MQMFQDIKAKLKIWNMDTFGDIKEGKEAVLRDIARIDSCEGKQALSFELVAQMAIMKVKLADLVLKEEVTQDKMLMFLSPSQRAFQVVDME